MSNNKKVPKFCITGALKMKRIDAIVMIHNKTLFPVDVIQNYNAHKSRFGL